MKILIALVAIFLSSCAAKTVYVTTPLPIPPEPDYVKVYGEDLMCLTEDAYMRLAITVTQRNEYIQTLIKVIRATHEAADD